MKRWLILVGIVAVSGYVFLRRGGGPPGIPSGEGFWQDEAAARAILDQLLRSVSASSEERRVLSYIIPIHAEARRFSLEPALIAAIIAQESGGRPDATGAVGERGLMQVRPTTADMVADHLSHRRPDPSSLYDPRTNIYYGAAYLRYQLDRYARMPNRIYWAVAAYNAGTAYPTDGGFTNQKYVDSVTNDKLPRYVYLLSAVYRVYGRPY